MFVKIMLLVVLFIMALFVGGTLFVRGVRMLDSTSPVKGAGLMLSAMLLFVVAFILVSHFGALHYYQM